MWRRGAHLRPQAGRLCVTNSNIRPLRKISNSKRPKINEEELRKLSERPLYPLTLADLVKNGRPPLSTAALYKSANFTLSILPIRLAHRIQALRNLPFIVVTNPNVSQIYDNYALSLSTLLPFAEGTIDTLENEERFTETLAGLVQTHADTIPILARGFLESRKYISPTAVTSFLDEHLRARIGTRLIAEQHVALHYATKAYHEGHHDIGPLSYIGIIDTALRPADVVRNCEAFVADICELKYGVRPTVVIDGEPDTRIAHVPMHLEYIITELLKNAFRATMEKGDVRDPIQVTIAPAVENHLLSNEGISSKQQGDTANVDPIVKPLQQATPGVTIRIRDCGGGISPKDYENIWNYSFTTFDEQEEDDTTPGKGGVDALSILSQSSAGGSSIAGLGYGLPLGRAYAEYFGGGIAVQSLWGWGTDVYLSLRGIGKLHVDADEEQ